MKNEIGTSEISQEYHPPFLGKHKMENSCILSHGFRMIQLFSEIALKHIQLTSSELIKISYLVEILI